MDCKNIPKKIEIIHIIRFEMHVDLHGCVQPDEYTIFVETMMRWELLQIAEIIIFIYLQCTCEDSEV